MGDIIIDMSNKIIPTKVFVNRTVDNIETQKLQFTLDKDVHLRTETGATIVFFGRDIDGNNVEVEMPISIEDLKDALDKFFWYLYDERKIDIEMQESKIDLIITHHEIQEYISTIIATDFHNQSLPLPKNDNHQTFLFHVNIGIE